MTPADCTDCGATFLREPDEHWKVRCLECWRARKAKAGESAGDEHLRWYRKGYRAGLEAAEAKRAPEPSLDKARLRELLQLAHPDKHGGSALAQRVTAWLLDLRKEARHAGD